MSRSTYTPIMTYTGAGNLAVYSFSFKIEALAQLLIKEYNTLGVETQSVRGTDVTYLSGVTFDAVEGSGVVTLAANLTTGYTLKILLANDAPTQPTEWREKFGFNLKGFEMAIDWVAGSVMRNAYLAQRSMRLSDYTLLSAFDPTLPIEVTDAVSQTIVTNAAGTALKIGPTASEIAAAQAYAVAAAASAAAALASEVAAAASAAAAALSAASSYSEWVEHAITDAQAATALTGETIDGTVYSAKFYEYEIIRGTTVFVNGTFALQYINSTWRVVTGAALTTIAHGVTITVTQATTIGTVKAALDTGAGSGTLKLSSRSIPV